MWEAPTESRNPTPWGTRGNKAQTENHSTKCDTKKRPKRPKRKEREKKGEKDEKDKKPKKIVTANPEGVWQSRKNWIAAGRQAASR
jgi:hypothetical protein